MALSIKDPTTEKLARDLASIAGETITAATRQALAERLARIKGSSLNRELLDDLAAIRRRWAQLQTLDSRSDEDIIGYDDAGIPR